MNKSTITKITVGRLFNLGNYEHVRYELTVEVPEGASAATAITAVEKILCGMKPLEKLCIASALDIERKQAEVAEMKTMPAVEWERRYGHCKGAPSEVIERYEKDLEECAEKRFKAIERAKTARQLFDDLGGTESWKDAKLDWEDDQY